ncbi:MAG: rhomboid family intramembrane serine protease [Bacteroidota bacterium]
MFGNLTPTVKNLLLINFVVYLMGSFVSIDFVDIFGLRFILAESFAPYQFFSYMFVHGSFFHIFGNMFALLIFGPMLERFWGPQKFLIFYMATGLGAGVLYGVADYFEKSPAKTAMMTYQSFPSPENFNFYVNEHAEFAYKQLYDFTNEYYDNPDSEVLEQQSKAYVKQLYQTVANIPMVGASGAVYGILMAFGMLFPNTVLFLLFPPIPIKAKYLVIAYGAFEIYSELNRSPGDNVAHLAHLSGMLIAFILIKMWQGNRNTFY